MVAFPSVRVFFSAAIAKEKMYREPGMIRCLDFIQNSTDKKNAFQFPGKHFSLKQNNQYLNNK